MVDFGQKWPSRERDYSGNSTATHQPSPFFSENRSTKLAYSIFGAGWTTQAILYRTAGFDFDFCHSVGSVWQCFASEVKSTQNQQYGACQPQKLYSPARTSNWALGKLLSYPGVLWATLSVFGPRTSASRQITKIAHQKVFRRTLECL